MTWRNFVFFFILDQLNCHLFTLPKYLLSLGCWLIIFYIWEIFVFFHECFKIMTYIFSCYFNYLIVCYFSLGKFWWKEDDIQEWCMRWNVHHSIERTSYDELMILLFFCCSKDLVYTQNMNLWLYLIMLKFDSSFPQFKYFIFQI